MSKRLLGLLLCGVVLACGSQAAVARAEDVPTHFTLELRTLKYGTAITREELRVQGSTGLLEYVPSQPNEAPTRTIKKETVPLGDLAPLRRLLTSTAFKAWARDKATGGHGPHPGYKKHALRVTVGRAKIRISWESFQRFSAEGEATRKELEALLLALQRRFPSG
jgi:hypothetical protein